MNTPTFHSILVAADLTPASAEVIRAAASLAGQTGARLHIVHACELPLTPYGTQAARSAVKQRIEDAAERLDEQVRSMAPASVRPASQEVHFGNPAEVVLERATRVEADLIVMGPHRPRPIGDFFLGSTADRMIRRAAVPCLIVRGELPLPLRRVMVPLDLSDPARGALDLALSWAVGLGAIDEGERVPGVEVTVAHVIPQIFGTESFPFDREVVAPELEREIQGAVVRTGAGAHVGICEKIVWGDVPAEELVALAEQETPDLLVIATHGYGALLRALIGSVASHVARRVPCSVLLVPPARWAADEPTVDAWAGIARGFVPAAPPM